MKHIRLATILAASLILSNSFYACKGKEKPAAADTSINNTQSADTAAMQSAPVQISPDDSLTEMAKDAVKDYPDVTATVNNGEVNLTGNITREKLPKLMMAVSAMHPKKINNNLTIK